MNFQIFKLDLEKAEEPEIKISTSLGSWKNKESSRKKHLLCFTDCTKAFDCVEHNKLENSERDRNIRPPDLPLEKPVYTGQEAKVRTGHGPTDWFQIEKGVCQGCILSPCLFNLYAEYVWAGRSTSLNQDCQEKYQ